MTIDYRPVTFREIPVAYLDGDKGMARVTGNNAAWMCRCGEPLPLIGTLFPPKRATVCPSCQVRFVLHEGMTVVEQVA